MKKWLVMVVAVLVLSLLPMKVQASSVGYYYESIDVQVEVNSAREFKITETLNVYYEEEMHGIIRSIPESGDVEGYIIADISVDGAPYQIEDNYDSKDIRIGDADVYVKGAKQYVVSYTLMHYQDYDQKHDYLYLNLIGNDFDTVIKKLTATITWPDNFEVEKVTLTDGSYGNRDSKKLTYTSIENGIAIESTAMFEEYEAATVQVSFPQNTFVDAPVYHFPYTILDHNIEIHIDEQQDWYVEQTIEIDSHDPYVFLHLNPEFAAFYSYHDELKDFKGRLDDNIVIDDEQYVEIENVGTHTIHLEYVIHPKKIIDETVYLLFVDQYEARTEHVFISLTMPCTPEYSIRFGRYGDVQEEARYISSIKGNTLFIESTMALQPAEGLEVELELDKADFYRPTPWWVFVLPIVGVVYVVGIVLMRLSMRQTMVTPVHFYPPNGVNSAEAGYLIDEKLSDVDMTSLIFYWASLGALKIHGIDKDDFMLEKIDELPSDCPAYEHRLFNDMFAYGSNNYVIEADLKKKFYRDIEIAKSSIQAKYTKTIPLRDKKINGVKIAVNIGSVILLCLVCMFSFSSAFGDGFFSFSLLPILLFMIVWGCLSSVFSVLSAVNVVMNATMYFIVFVFVLISDTYTVPLLVVLGCGLLSLLAVSNMKRYTQTGLELIGDIKGFKEFLMHAEKDQLEMLIHENPEYYYDILPYAQALHVTKIWQDKFSDIAIAPPSYYEGEFKNYRNYNSFTNQVQKSMRRSMSAPASSSSGSSGSSSSGGYSGGGGGFSSGGSSGGGSGGGGSRGW